MRIKDSEISVEQNLEKIREHLKNPYKGVVRFRGKTAQQISQERYNKVLAEVNFDYNKLHTWIYAEKNKNRVEIIKKSEFSPQDNSEIMKAIEKFVQKNAQTKWRFRFLAKNNDYFAEALINEETGQVFYLPGSINGLLSMYKQNLWIPSPKVIKPKEKPTATLIFLHGTYGAGSLDQMTEKFPSLKVIHPHSPTLQYDMWHGARRAPGGQCQGWINITGDAHEIMESDVCPNNPSRINYAEADQAIHLDYPQLRRAVDYVNEIIEQEIKRGIAPEKVFVAGFSQGGLLTLAVALISQHKLGGFISLCGLLPRRDKLLKITANKNKKTPLLIINNSQDPWIPFWTGRKTYEILQNRGYNVEFKTHPGSGHSWKNEDVIIFLEKCLHEETVLCSNNKKSENSVPTKLITIIGISLLAIILLVVFGIWSRRKNRRGNK